MTKAQDEGNLEKLSPNFNSESCDKELNFSEKKQLKALLGPGHEVVSVVKEQKVKSEEVVMVNGTPIALEGEEGEKIKDSLLSGKIPSQDLINHLLMKAGLVLKPVKQVVETEMTLSSSSRTCEASVVKCKQDGSTLSKGVTVSQEVNSMHKSHSFEVNPDVKCSKIQAESCGKKSFFKHLDDTLNGLRNSDEIYTLLLWSRFYATPTRILTQFVSKFDAFQQNSQKNEEKIENVFQILSNWITWFPEDFGDEAMMQKLRRIFQTCSSKNGPKSGNNHQHLLATLSSHLAAIKRHEVFLEKCNFVDSKKLDTPVQNISPLSSAQELTRLELEYLSYLSPSEFINVFAREKLNSICKSDSNVEQVKTPVEEDVISDARVRSAQKTKNLDSYVEWFNHLSFIVASSVCQVRKKKDRVKLIEYWIEVARVCVNVGNFNSLMGIITGLNMFPVSRLRKTWSHVRSGKFSVLEHQMDPSCNFLSYRSTLDAAVIRSEAATDDKQKIIIPFFSLFVKDLYTAKEEITFEENFDLKSLMQISMTIREFSKWKVVNCPFEKCSDFAKFLLHTAVPNLDRLDYESFLCEIPKTQMERDQYKNLKTKYKTASTSEDHP